MPITSMLNKTKRKTFRTDLEAKLAVNKIDDDDYHIHTKPTKKKIAQISVCRKKQNNLLASHKDT